MSNTIDVCQTGYDYERYQLNELENENMKLKKRLEIATKALEEIPDLAGNNENGINDYGIVCCAQDALKEMEGVK